ncbi:MAG: hypothetical protein J1E81_05130 [Eubacterium sp.]|nr:hypothetical protein [Eubacterium sp.]
MPQRELKFIFSKPYNFTDNGKRVTGITCQCYDPVDKSIVKVKTNHLVDADLGDDILVDVEIKGRYVNYKIAE